MSDDSAIEWTDATWNPLRGCTKVSPGCKNCYAETFAERWRGTPGHPYEQGFDLRLVPELLDRPLRWTRPRKIFANSMSDLFHPGVSDGFIGSVFLAMALADWHVFQVLTKRAARMKAYLSDRSRLADLEHVWLGVSVEDRRYGVTRIAELQDTPAAVRFLSVEPLLEDLGTLDLTGIDWVIVGGESGPGARPMRADWVRSIRDQCAAADVPFFFKQWGGLRKKIAGRLLDGVQYDGAPPVTPPCPPDAREMLRRRRELRRWIDGQPEDRDTVRAPSIDAPWVDVVRWYTDRAPC